MPDSETLVTPRRLVLSFLVAAAIVGLVASFQLTKEKEPKVTVRDAAVEQIFPAEGDLRLRQDRIGIDLKPGWTGDLYVEGIEVTEGIERIEPLNQVFYTPQPGDATGQLRPGRRCAYAFIWELTKSRERGHRTPGWCFNVH